MADIGRSHAFRALKHEPEVARLGPKQLRVAPRGAEDFRDVSVVYAAVAAKRKKIPQAPKCLLPLSDADEEGIQLDLRGMNLTDDEAMGWKA